MSLTTFNPQRVAWAAGFLDGEGWFGIPGRDHRGHWRPPCIEAAQVATRAPLDELAELFGGTVKWCRSAWVWRLYARQAVAEALMQLTPYLRVKGDQASLLLAFSGTFAPRGTTDIGPLVHGLRDVLRESVLEIRRSATCS